MQTPTNDEIQREIDSIRSMRRISSQSGPGSLTLDPDLPPQSPSGSSPGSSGSLSPNAAYSALSGTAEDEPILPNDAASGFFWVPASLHPELAPSEFKAFLRNHKRDIEEGGDDAESSVTGLSRMGSGRLNRSTSGLSRSSSGLGRKKSMLSRQYHPKEGDSGDIEEEDEEIKPIKRNRSIYANEAPQLTIKDLQKLDDLADAAAAGNNTETDLIRRQLRRSISLGYTGNIIDQIDAIQDDEENTPVVVPAKALQRTARTRIRKPGLEGDGNGHRFASTRRGKRKPTLDSGVPPLEDGTSRPTSDMTSSDRTSLSDQEGEPYARPSAPSPDLDHEEGPQPRFAEPEQRPVSIGESIYDAYGSDARESAYYDARESLSQGSHRGGTSGDYAHLTATAPSEPKTRGAVIYDTAEDEPFFTASHPAAASLPNVAITSERDTRAPSGATVVLRSRSPDREKDQLPLTRQGSGGRREKPPESIEMPPNQYSSRPPRDQQQYQQPSQQSQHPSYPQPLPPSQQMYQSSQQQYGDGLHHPTPKRHLDVPNAAQPGVSPPSSPELIRTPSISPSGEIARPFSAPPTSSGRPTSAGKEKEKEKGKSRGWFGLGGGKEKSEKEKHKEKEKEKEREKEMLKKKKEEKKTPKEEKEASGGLFGIFGSKKPKQENDSPPNGNSNPNSMSGKNQGNRQMTPFAAVSPTVAGQYARYPLHVERAIYRLSHIKLANPRRPLYEQVLISNLMFWYLGIINKPAVPAGQQQQGQLPASNQAQDPQGQPQTQPASGPPPGAMITPMSPSQQVAVAQAAAAAAAEKAQLEQEQLAREKEAREREEREREMREIQEREMREREQREKLERERLEKEREKPPRKSLTKADRDGRSRKADMPVKSPNYDAQSRTMDQERANGRPNTAPSSGGPGAGSGYGQPGHTSYHLPQRAQGQQQRGNQPPQQPHFYQQDMGQVVYQPLNPYALPPGAKPPALVENTWAASSTNENGRSASKSPPPHQYYSSGAPANSSGSSDSRPRPSRSPPPHDYLAAGIPGTGSNSGMPNGARPARSLSANAVNKKSSGPASSESYPPTTNSTSSKQTDYDRPERPSHQYSQSANASLLNGAPTSPTSPGSSALSSGSGSGSGSAKLLKKKSTTTVQPSNVAPNDGTKPIPRKRKSVETGAADRRGVVEPEVPFENMWQFQGYGKQAGYAPQAQQQGLGPYH